MRKTDMKILLLGKDGQVGWDLQRSLAPLGQLKSCGRQEADLENLNKLRVIVRDYRPNIIVNAAAYTAVDRAESEPDKAYRVNAKAVGFLADEARRLDAWLIHYSTDYVFDGTKPSPYVETDRPNPLSVYGRTKLQGEEAIRQSGCKYLIFRTSWVFGVHGNNFVKTILRLAKERDNLKIVADQHGVPTSAKLIADITAQSIPVFTNSRLHSGIYHLTAKGHATWHELARQVVNRAQRHGMDLSLTAGEIRAISTTDYPTPAKRPQNSVLDTNLLTKALGISLPEWQAGVDAVVGYIVKQEASQ